MMRSAFDRRLDLATLALWPLVASVLLFTPVDARAEHHVMFSPVHSHVAGGDAARAPRGIHHTAFAPVRPRTEHGLPMRMHQAAHRPPAEHARAARRVNAPSPEHRSSAQLHPGPRRNHHE